MRRDYFSELVEFGGKLWQPQYAARELDDNGLVYTLLGMWKGIELAHITLKTVTCKEAQTKRGLGPEQKKVLRGFEREARRRHLLRSTKDLLEKWKARKSEPIRNRIIQYVRESDFSEDETYMFLRIFDRNDLWIDYDDEYFRGVEFDFEQYLKDVSSTFRFLRNIENEDRPKISKNSRGRLKAKLFDIIRRYKEKLIEEVLVEDRTYITGGWPYIFDAKVEHKLHEYGDVIRRCAEIGQCLDTYHYEKDEDYRHFIDHLLGRTKSLGLDIEIPFLETAGKVGLVRFVYLPRVNLEPMFRLVRTYEEVISYLVEKSKPHGKKDFKPEGLLAKLLDSDNYLIIRDYLQNPVFLNHVYEGRTPAYSWSARDGEPMQRALTSGEYRAGYIAERRLIKSAVRDMENYRPGTPLGR